MPKQNKIISKKDVRAAAQNKKALNQIQESLVNAATNAMQANREAQNEESVIISTSDFDANKELINAKQEETITNTITPGEAERQRRLNLIANKETFTAVTLPQEATEISETQQEATEISETQQEKINKIKTALAMQQPKPDNKMTLAHYKTLLELKRFHTLLTVHKVLYGISGPELDRLEKVMREVFQPDYNTDFWCRECVKDFLKDLYMFFNNWQQEQAERVKEYNTILKRDKWQR